MASGDTLFVFDVGNNRPPSSGFAVPVQRAGHWCLEFHESSDEEAIFPFVMPRNYSGGGTATTLVWMAEAPAVSGTARFEVAWERHDDEGTDLDSDSFATAKGAGGTAPATNGAVQYTTVTHSNGTEMDNIQVGESGRLKLRRDADGSGGTDDLTTKAHVLRVEVREL